jgi:hypothetical protein
MTHQEVSEHEPEALPLLIERAAAALAKATTPAEFLEARDKAAFVYDAAKQWARWAKAKQAHDEILAACRKAQGDALLIEARAMMHLADEYDAAQTRGEVPSAGRPKTKIIPDENNFASAKLMMTARKIRAAEQAKPGIVEKTLTAGEPTRARLMRAVEEALTPPPPPPPPPPVYTAPAPTVVEPQQPVQCLCPICEIHPKPAEQRDEPTPAGKSEWCSFCGRDFGPCPPDDEPLDLWVYNSDDYKDDEWGRICFDCAKDAYAFLLSSREEAKAKARAKKAKKD